MNKSHNFPDCWHCKARFKSVFCDLNEETLTQLDSQKGCSLYKKGQFIFNEGSYSHGLYCVNSGKIKIVQTGETGKEHIIRLVKEGDIIGYSSLLSGERYSCSAITLEESSVCFISKTFFFSLVTTNMNLAVKMIHLLINELKMTEQKLIGMAQKPVRERFAEAILFLKEVYGCGTDNNTLNISLSREELASIVGTARETATRLLSEFKEDRIVEVNGKKIRITDNQKLIKTANLQD